MIRLLADDNLNRNIVHGIRRVLPAVDIMIAQEAGLVGAQDPEVLGWVAEHGRIVVSHDISTIPPAACKRVRNGLPMPGVMKIGGELPVGVAVAALELVVMCDDPLEWQDNVVYLPL